MTDSTNAKIAFWPRKIVQNKNSAGFVKESDLANHLGLFVTDMQRIRRRGELAFYKFGRRCVYRWDDVETFLASKRIDSGSKG